MSMLKKIEFIIVLTFALFIITGCSGNPGEELAKSELQKKLDKYFRYRFSVEELIKTDGISSENNKIKKYSLEYQAKIKALKKPPSNIAIWNVSGIKLLFGDNFIKDIYFLKENETAIMFGTMEFIKTEKGWRPE